MALDSVKYGLLRFRQKIQLYVQLIKLYRKSLQRIKTKKAVIVEISNFNQGRYGFQLLNYFHEADYHMVMKNSFDFLLNLNSYDLLILELKNISIYNKYQVKRFNGKLYKRNQ